MYFHHKRCFAFAFAGALSSTSEEANLYLDTLLSDLLPSAVRALNLDPAPVSSTNVTVRSTGFTNHDLRVVLTNIRLHGLASRLRHRGDCDEPAWKGACLTTSCYVSLDGLRLSYDASARGFDWLGSRVKFAFQAVLSKANANIDVTSAFGKCKGAAPSRVFILHFKPRGGGYRQGGRDVLRRARTVDIPTYSSNTTH